MTPDEYLDQIAADLAPRGATAGQMFGKRSLMADGTSFACLKDDRLAFKLGAGTAEHAAALALPDARLFDPSGKHRPFKDWVAIPMSSADQWPAYAESALGALSRG